MSVANPKAAPNAALKAAMRVRFFMRLVSIDFAKCCEFSKWHVVPKELVAPLVVGAAVLHSYDMGSGGRRDHSRMARVGTLFGVKLSAVTQDNPAT
jgi:hypothetical protein